MGAYLVQARDAPVEPSPRRPSIRFYAFIICDLTENLRKQARYAKFQLMSDGRGFFGFHEEYNNYVEIISFEKLVDDAQARNRILFDKLENRT